MYWWEKKYITWYGCENENRVHFKLCDVVFIELQIKHNS